MRLTSSTYSSFKSLSKSAASALMIAGLVCACSKHSTTDVGSDATGKGNGGNNLFLSKAETDKILNDLKPNLEILFEGLHYLVMAEKTSPNVTELGQNPELLKNLDVMFGNENAAMKDLKTSGNLVPQGAPCTDFRGVENAAAAVIGDIGGKICFSRHKIESTSLRNFAHADEIFVLGLGTHEFEHHFITTGDHDAAERGARAVQDFVEKQLARQVELQDPDVISTDDTGYLEQFRDEAKAIYDNAVVSGVGDPGNG